MSVAVYVALLCFLAYNFFFISPRYTLYIAGGQGVVTVAVFLVVSQEGRRPKPVAAYVPTDRQGRLRSSVT